MERFVRTIVGGGLVLVAGLWVVSSLLVWSLPWLLGAVLVLVGAAALAYGVWLELDY